MGGQKESVCLENTENTSVLLLFQSGLSEANLGNSRLQTLKAGVEIRLSHFQPLYSHRTEERNPYLAVRFTAESPEDTPFFLSSHPSKNLTSNHQHALNSPTDSPEELSLLRCQSIRLLRGSQFGLISLRNSELFLRRGRHQSTA